MSRRTGLVFLVAGTLLLSFLWGAMPLSAHAQGPTPGITLQKSVTVNGLGYSTSGTAVPGDSLTYHLEFSNTSSMAATNLTVTDVLRPGQVALNAVGAGCTYVDSSRTVTCSVPILGPGATGNVWLTVGVQDGFAGPIVNDAQVVGDSVPATMSNRTVVWVAGPSPTISASSLVLCGQVTAYNGWGVTISGVTIPFAIGSHVTGAPVMVGGDYCLALTLKANGMITSLSAISNLAGVGYVCGLYSVPASNASSSVMMSGLTLSVIPTFTLPLALTPGQSYCLLLNSSGAVIGLLSNVPVAASAVDDYGAAARVGRLRAQ